MASLLTKPMTNEFSLTIMGGADKGTVIKLVMGRITIGRGSDNDIVIKDDPKVSRNHAKLVVSANGVQISDTSDRNKLVVNGIAINNTELTDGAIIELGETKFRFHSNNSQELKSVELEPVSNPAITAFQASSPTSTNMNLGVPPRARRRLEKPKPYLFYIILGGVLIFFLWLYTSKPSTSSNANGNATDPQVLIANNEKTVEELNAERDREGHNSPQYKEAQPNFVKGFRDYYKGQYERAIESFQACLSLFPEHPQCKRYLNLSLKKYSELIQYHMILGGKYKEQGQFDACSAEYKNVLEMVKDPTQKTFQEARSGLDACTALSGDKY
jgi:pSer/pThr/pTyr-binding forkhead associated (FHA) protein